MMTSRAEYRLFLRQDNADLRLTEIGYKFGLVTKERYKKFLRKKRKIEELEATLKTVIVPSEKLQEFLKSPAPQGISYENLLKRSNINIFMAKKGLGLFGGYSRDELNQVGINVKYAGYLAREKMLIERNRKLEEKIIPESIDYLNLKGLRIEARQKLNEIRPKTIGQASRISGVNPADINILILYVK